MNEMKGYLTGSGYMGFVNGEYILFETEEAYIQYYNDNEKSKNEQSDS